ncbi:sigma-70 family RNA polymerase sigma factor [Streptosporangiaceae bacterium NEAU-GS5]|nr:sigma-70 family RNA polymerase sigma factor [Streptosporangiaceae bacterium NEAU-GS5]
MSQELQVYLARIGEIPLLTASEEVALAKRIEAGTYAEHLLEESPGRDDLRAVAADGVTARDHLIRANLRLVVSIARGYTSEKTSVLDVIQDGNVGLIDAVDRFDHERGLRFSTCATWWIRKAILRGLETGQAVRIPARVLYELRRIRRAETHLALAWGRAPTPGEIARQAGGSTARVARLRRYARICELTSLDLPIGMTTLGELVEGPPWSRPEAIAESRALRAEIAEAAGTVLAPRQAQIIRELYGLSGAERSTHAQLARHIGTTGGWVRRMEREALAVLRANPSIAAWAG